MRRGRLAAPLGALLAVVAPAEARERLTVGLSQYPPSLHPAYEAAAAKSYIHGFVRRPITRWTYRWAQECVLCVALPSLETGGARRETTPDGKPGLAVDVEIRADARWGDGTPVTAADVLLSWEIGRHPETGVTAAESFRRIWRIDAHDDRRLTLHLDREAYDYARLGDFNLVPAHLEAEAFADPPRYRQRSRYEAEPTHPGLWNGPYLVARVAVGSEIQLVRNPHWAGPTPPFDRVTVRAIENTAALEANLLSGAIDVIPGELGLSLEQALAFEKRHGTRFRVGYQAGLFYEHVDLKLDHPILADRRVRQALLLAIDRETLAARLYDGRQPVAHGPGSPLDPVSGGETPIVWTFDPERARAMLTEAGWRPGPDGIRLDAAGRRLSLPFATTSGNRSRELLQQVLQAQWRGVGVEAVIRNQTPRTLFAELSRREFGAMALFAWISAPDQAPRTILHSGQIPSAGNAWSGQNYTGYAEPEMDRTLDALETTLDPARRKALWSDLARLYARDLPALPLFHRAQAYVLPRWLVEGGAPTGHLEPSSQWVETWRTEP